jgi:hypothetical protein
MFSAMQMFDMYMSLFMRDKPILRRRGCHVKEYDRKGSLTKRTPLVKSLKRLGAKAS